MSGSARGEEREFRRHVLAAGTRHYPDDPDLPDLPGVPGDVERVAELFQGMGYTRILPHLGSGPRSQDLIRDLEEWLGHPDRSERDVLVVYYAGHGIKHPQLRDHYLMCGGSRIARPQSTAIRSSDLAAMVTASSIGHCLLILDTCYAGAGTGEMATVAAELAPLRSIDSDGLWLLAAARAREEAVDHALVPALETAVRDSRAGMRQPHLDFPDIAQRIDDHLREHHPHQSARWSAVEVRTPPPFFPNPEYRPGLSPALVDVQTAREWAAHFDPRSRGVEYPSEKGDFFTGRRQALAALSAWLRDPVHNGRARVVTGSPGSGKSALLGRLLAGADPASTLRQTAPEFLTPPPGCITTAIHARGMSLESLTRRLAAALGIEADSTHQLLSELAERTVTTTVLIDALDEAGTGVNGTEPQRIARELLRPLTVLRHLRLIVGTRRETIDALGSAVELIDLDTDSYTGHGDIERYVYDFLVSSGAAERGCEPDVMRTIAEAVAERAQQSFLVARMTVRALAHGDLVVDPAEPDWQKRLPTEVGQAFDAYLARYGDDQPKVRRLLTPLAYAEGEGLPWDSLWARLAGALSQVPCSDDDVEWLFRHAGAYVVEVATDDERSVFRLYHEALAEHLRDPRRAVENQRRLTRVLMESVPVRSDGDRDWSRAHPYVLEHLPGHAAAAGELDGLLTDPFFLVHADPDALLAAMADAEDHESVRIRAMYRASAHLHRGLPPESRAQLLAVDAARFGLEEHRRSLSRRLMWAPRWATGMQTSSALRTTMPYHGLLGVADCATVNGVPLLVAAGSDQAVWLWDLSTGSLRSALTGHEADLSALCFVVLDGEPVVVSADRAGAVRVWSVADEAPRLCFDLPTDRDYRDYLERIACTVVDGSPVLVGESHHAVLRSWDLRTGALVHELDRPARQMSLHEAPQVIVTTNEGKPAHWDLLTGALTVFATSERLSVESSWTGALEGRVTTLLGGMTGDLWEWDPASASLTRCFQSDKDSVTAITVVPRPEGDLIVMGHDDGTIHVLSACDRTLVSSLHGHDDWVDFVASVVVGDTCVLVSASSDRTIRLWDVPTEEGHPAPVGHTSGVRAVACLVADGTPIAVTGADDHTIRSWGLDTGAPLGKGRSGAVLSLAHTRVDGVPIAVTASYGAVSTWSLPRCELLSATREAGYGTDSVDVTVIGGKPTVLSSSPTVIGAGRKGPQLRDAATLDLLPGTFPIAEAFQSVAALACTVLDGGPVAVIVELHRRADGPQRYSVHVWDLTAMHRLASGEGESSQVNALACTVIGGTPLALVATTGGVHVWDLVTMSQTSTLSPGWFISGVTCASIDGIPTAVTAEHRGLRLWNLTNGRLLHEQALPHLTEAVAVGPDGELVVGSGYEVIVLERTNQNPAGSV